MRFQTKGEIETLVGQMQFLVDTINRLMGNLDDLCNVLTNRTALCNHLQNIKNTLLEAGKLFGEQIKLYMQLANQSELPDVEAAEETLAKIKGREHEIIIIKGRLHYQISVLPQFMIVAEEIKELAEPVKASLVAIQQELKLIAS